MPRAFRHDDVSAEYIHTDRCFLSFVTQQEIGIAFQQVNQLIPFRVSLPAFPRRIEGMSSDEGVTGEAVEFPVEFRIEIRREGFRRRVALRPHDRAYGGEIEGPHPRCHFLVSLRNIRSIIPANSGGADGRRC